MYNIFEVGVLVDLLNDLCGEMCDRHFEGSGGFDSVFILLSFFEVQNEYRII